MNEIEEKVINILSVQFGIEKNVIVLDRELTIYGMNSISYIELVVNLENFYHIEFDMDYLNFDSLNTIKKLADYIITLI